MRAGLKASCSRIPIEILRRHAGSNGYQQAEVFHYRMTAEMLEWQEESGYTMRQIVTIASMIEKEAANDTEQYTIASVIYNRLNKDWPLQIDSTTLYEYPRPRGRADGGNAGSKDSPYNYPYQQGTAAVSYMQPRHYVNKGGVAAEQHKLYVLCAQYGHRPA